MNRSAFLSFFAVSTLAFVFVWQQLQATRLGYDVDKTRKQMRQQQEVNAYLRLQLAQLNSPERLAKDARERLSMHASSPENQIILEKAKL